MLKGNSLTFIKRITAFLLCITAVMIFMRYIPAFASANAEEAPSADAAPEYKSFSDLSGRTVGMLTAAPFEELIREYIPDVGDIQYFSSPADLTAALGSGKIDAFLTNNAAAQMMVNLDSSLAIFPETLGDTDYGFAFAKGSPDLDKWQAAYDSIGKERIDELWDIWTGTDDSKKVLPKQDWEGKNGTVKAASCDSVPPLSYAGDSGELMGFDIAVMLEIAKVLDIHLEFKGMEFSAVLAEVESGKAQVGNSSLMISEERKKLADLMPYHKASYMLVVRAAEEQAAPDRTPELQSSSDLSGKTVAMLTGAPFEELVRAKNPDVGDVQYFTAAADMQLALKAGKIDAFLTNNAVATMMINQDADLALFPESLGDNFYGFAFAKNDPDCAKWQEAYDSIDKKRIDELWDIWLGTDDSKKVLPKQDWEGKNGTVKVASCDSLPPMSYVGDSGEITGFDIAVMLEIAKVLDIHLDLTGMEFSSVMAEVQSGKSKVANGSILTSDERKKLMDFVPYHEAQFVLVVRTAEKETADTSFIQSLKDSFERTFITDSRWKMIFLGLLRTIVMAVCSGILGTLLGFGLVFLRHKNNAVINKLISLYSSLITGIPVVVTLMVFYFIVFGKFDTPALLVSIVGFTVIFGARAYGLIQNAVTAVDGGQREAALALGYSEKLAFRRVVLPQSRSIYFPTLKTQFVMLLKETSVAGYITVLEMTRAVDLVRSRTMEAFFPLITAAVIYFILTWLLTRIITMTEKKLSKKRGQRRIKGVD